MKNLSRLALSFSLPILLTACLQSGNTARKRGVESGAQQSMDGDEGVFTDGRRVTTKADRDDANEKYKLETARISALEQAKANDAKNLLQQEAEASKLPLAQEETRRQIAVEQLRGQAEVDKAEASKKSDMPEYAKIGASFLTESRKASAQEETNKIAAKKEDRLNLLDQSRIEREFSLAENDLAIRNRREDREDLKLTLETTTPEERQQERLLAESELGELYGRAKAELEGRKSQADSWAKAVGGSNEVNADILAYKALASGMSKEEVEAETRRLSSRVDEAKGAAGAIAKHANIVGRSNWGTRAGAQLMKEHERIMPDLRQMVDELEDEPIDQTEQVGQTQEPPAAPTGNQEPSFDEARAPIACFTKSGDSFSREAGASCETLDSAGGPGNEVTDLLSGKKFPEKTTVKAYRDWVTKIISSLESWPPSTKQEAALRAALIEELRFRQEMLPDESDTDAQNQLVAKNLLKPITELSEDAVNEARDAYSNGAMSRRPRAEGLQSGMSWLSGTLDGISSKGAESPVVKVADASLGDQSYEFNRPEVGGRAIDPKTLLCQDGTRGC